ncbi:MAG: DUF3226 domain-containing protein [Pirellulaceae bacterium]
MANTFIAVEGPQDVELIAAVLKPRGFKKKVHEDDLPERFGKRLIRKDYPIDGDLHARVPNPMFMTDGSNWVAIQSAGGATLELITLVSRVLNALKSFPGALDAIGIVRDTDELSAPEQFAHLRTELSSRLNREPEEFANYELQLPMSVNENIIDGKPNFGIYMLPDNEHEGTLENLVLECGECIYPQLVNRSRDFVDDVRELAELNSKDKSQVKKPFGKEKAIIAAAVSILKPGMSLAVSLDQNRWFSEESLNLPSMKKLIQFLRNLCQLES